MGVEEGFEFFGGMHALEALGEEVFAVDDGAVGG